MISGKNYAIQGGTKFFEQTDIDDRNQNGIAMNELNYINQDEEYQDEEQNDVA